MSELGRLRQVWRALGCASNPDDFKPSVQEKMWDMALDMIRESIAGDTRIYRENQALEGEIQRLRQKHEPTDP